MKKKQVTLNEEEIGLLKLILNTGIETALQYYGIILKEIYKKLNTAAWISDDSEQTPNNGENPNEQEIINLFKEILKNGIVVKNNLTINAFLLSQLIDKHFKKDNPVGQIFTAIELEMLTLMLNADDHISVENRNHFLTKLRSISKPRETDKEQVMKTMPLGIDRELAYKYGKCNYCDLWYGDCTGH